MRVSRQERPARRRGRRLPPEQRREELLDAVEAVVARRGYAGTTVPLVVAEAGVAQGSFYRYFRDVDDAFAALTRRVLPPVAEAAFALQLADLRTAADVERELRRYYQVLAEQLAAHPAVVREALLVAPSSTGKAGRELAAFLRQMREYVGTLIAKYVGRGPFRAGDPEIAAAAVVGMVLGAAQAATEPGASFDPERWAREMARLESGALVRPSADDAARSVRPLSTRGRVVCGGATLAPRTRRRRL
jgi:AcrR family transcriptional regulator